MSAIPKKVRDRVVQRAAGTCEGCGAFRPLELHHRKYRSRLGKHEVENLVALCGMGNVKSAGCHGVAHSGEGHELGWSVHSWDDPALIPVLYRGVLSWLTRDGRVVDVGPEPNF